MTLLVRSRQSACTRESCDPPRTLTPTPVDNDITLARSPHSPSPFPLPLVSLPLSLSPGRVSPSCLSPFPLPHRGDILFEVPSLVFLPDSRMSTGGPPVIPRTPRENNASAVNRNDKSPARLSTTKLAGRSLIGAQSDESRALSGTRSDDR